MTLREEILKDSGILNEGVLRDIFRLRKLVFKVFEKEQAKELCEKLSSWLNTWNGSAFAAVLDTFIRYFENEEQNKIIRMFNEHTDPSGHVSFRDIFNEIKKDYARLS